MVQRSAPAPFLTKTYQLVDDGSTDEIVSWNEIGTTFIIWSTADFAKDLLPNYFKHCNYSSFVRQLNTYGFRKITADKWEFSNENFKRGQKELLIKIRRRKALHHKSSQVPLPAAAAPILSTITPSNSGDDSTFSCSPDSKNPGSSTVEAIAAITHEYSHDELAEENEKLRKDNEMLSTELTEAKKQCHKLVSYLTKQVKVGADQINEIMQPGSNNNGPDHSVDNIYPKKKINSNNNNDGSASSGGEGGREDCLKLFGVWLKKRGRDENSDFVGHRKEMKKSSIEFDEAPWMKITSKVCI
ncbi:heat shock factor protein HSF24-like [Impatiens glandulifera]|uniref:heat shock factor protein HSF24-like n=1 Tax=Impatiens glandulifera TaxID=253017 RepID=UPI001FB101C8|nr:heat shock factor protein HSF24-like [Impatiens glandulifera]